MRAKEVVLRPGVFGGLAGTRESAELGTNHETDRKLRYSQCRRSWSSRIRQLPELGPTMGQEDRLRRVCRSPCTERTRGMGW